MISSIFKYALVCTVLANSTANLYASEAHTPYSETKPAKDLNISSIDQIIKRLEQEAPLFDQEKILKNHNESFNSNDAYKSEAEIHNDLKGIFKKLKEIFQSGEKYPINLNKDELINSICTLLNEQNQPLTPANFLKFYSQSILLQSYIFYKNASNSLFWNTLTEQNVNNYIADLKFLVENLCSSDNSSIVDLDALDRISYVLQRKPERDISFVDDITIFNPLRPEIHKNVTELFLNTKYFLTQPIDELDAPTIIQNIRDRIRCIYPEQFLSNISAKLRTLSLELYQLPKEKSAYSSELTQKIKEWHSKFLKDSKTIKETIASIAQEDHTPFGETPSELDQKTLELKGLGIFNELENWIKMCHQNIDNIKKEIFQILEEINKNMELYCDLKQPSITIDKTVFNSWKTLKSIMNDKVKKTSKINDLQKILQDLLEIEYDNIYVNEKDYLQFNILMYLANNHKFDAPTEKQLNKFIEDKGNFMSDDLHNFLLVSSPASLLYKFLYGTGTLDKTSTEITIGHFSRKILGLRK